MPHLPDFFTPAYNFLVGLDPSLPRALFVALVFVSVLAWRKLWPSGWLKFSSLIPVSDEDTSWFKTTLLKVWQALPSALLGAVYGALGTGGNVLASLKLAALALLAPVIHEVAWRYQGNLGTKKNPPPGIPAGPLLVLVVFLLSFRLGVACSPFAAEWPAIAQHCAPSNAVLLEDVRVVLANTDDLWGQLEKIAVTQGKAAVECAVQQLVADEAGRMGAARDDHSLARGRAFLAKVHR